MAHLIELDGIGPTIGDAVTVGHGALLEGCTIDGGVVIGMGATVLQHAPVGERTMMAVEDYQELRRRYLAAGTETIAPR